MLYTKEKSNTLIMRFIEGEKAKNHISVERLLTELRDGSI